LGNATIRWLILEKRENVSAATDNVPDQHIGLRHAIDNEQASHWEAAQTGSQIIIASASDYGFIVNSRTRWVMGSTSRSAALLPLIAAT
jgi:hypothetical protein